MKQYKLPYSKEEKIAFIKDIYQKHGGIPLTVRQFYYDLIQNYNYVPEAYFKEWASISQDMVDKRLLKVYHGVSDILTSYRREGIIPWEWVIDETREIIKPATFRNVSDFYENIGKYYRRDLMQGQSKHIEIWCEKVLGGLKELCEKYTVGLMMGQGEQSATNLYESALRFKEINKPVKILYLGDFDPSGVKIENSISEDLVNRWGCDVEVRRVLITDKYASLKHLPSLPAKTGDPNFKKYFATYGTDRMWELQAADPNELLAITESAILGEIETERYIREKIKVGENELDITDDMENLINKNEKS